MVLRRLCNVDDSQTGHPIDYQTTHAKTLCAIPTTGLRVIMFPNAIFLDHINPLPHKFIDFVTAGVRQNTKTEVYCFPCL